MNTVLVVDDDESFLLSLIDGFKSYEDQFGIVTAHNGEEAVAILNEEDIQLVLTDLKMPKMDGFALVAHLSAHHPELPVIVMTAFGTPDMEESLKEIGAFQYIEKPIDFNLLVTKILKGLEGRSQGFISGVSLGSFLQLLELDKKTCTLIIRSGKLQGSIYFRNGELLDAETGELSGTDAAYEIINWSNVEIELNSTCAATEQKIHESLGFILLEGSRRHDEGDRISSPAPASEGDHSRALDPIDLSGIDLGLDDFLADDSPTSLLPPAAPPTPATSETSSIHSANPIIAQFVSMLHGMPEILHFSLISKEGGIIHASAGIDEQFANFLTYVVVVGEQLQMAMGTGAQQHCLLHLSNNNKMLILRGKEVNAGLEIEGNTQPGPIAIGLRPTLNRISLQ